jgi:NADH:ubiquinone oxidoreductase subunit 5 (subunit L)/multisubunit Na+/H+ antiporter MnhA subunit
MGAAAILFGSVVALRQRRLKLLVAYSTVAQIGYLFLMFPLAFSPVDGQPQNGGALAGGILQAVSHATAKAAMFMAAGSIYVALGHDHIARLAGLGRAMPVSVLAFALGGLALIGVPPSGAYLAKNLLLQAAGDTQQWWLAVVVQLGGVFTNSYLVLVLAHALAPAGTPDAFGVPVPRGSEAPALVLALCSLLLGLFAWDAFLPIPHDHVTKPFDLASLADIVWPILAGAMLAILLGSWGNWPVPMAYEKALAAIAEPLRRAALKCGDTLERADATVRQWTAACLSLLVLGLLLSAAMLVGR